MIILDANILKSTSLRGPAADVLRTIRAAKVERVVAPWIALEEIAAQQALIYQEKHMAAVAAMDALRKATPWGDIAGPREHDTERVRRHWRERYGEIADVIQTSPTAYQTAMFRETNLMAPCKTVNSGKHKTGARDAAIWLTAVEYARDHPEETVYFVSNNTEDFGDGTSFPAPMDEDLKGMEDRFFLFTSLDGVLEKFATDIQASTEDVRPLLDNEMTYSVVLHAARMAGKRRRFGSMPGTRLHRETGEAGTVVNPRLFRPSTIRLGEVLDVSAREIDGHKWFTASVRWLLAAQDGLGPLTGEPDRIAYSWQTRVLLSPTASTSKGITVLDSQRPGPVTSEEIAQVPALPRPRNDDLLRQLAREAREAGASLEFLNILDDLRSSAPGCYPPLEDSLRYLSGRADGETYRRIMEVVHRLEGESEEAP